MTSGDSLCFYESIFSAIKYPSLFKFTHSRIIFPFVSFFLGLLSALFTGQLDKDPSSL